MQVTGMLYGAKMLQFVGFPTAEVLGPSRERRGDQGAHRPLRLSVHQAGVQGWRRQEGQGGTARAGEGPEDRTEGKGAALLRRAPPWQPVAKANGVTFEGGVPAEHEVYFSITDSTRLSRADDDADASWRRGHRGAREEDRQRRSPSIR